MVNHAPHDPPHFPPSHVPGRLLPLVMQAGGGGSGPVMPSGAIGRWKMSDHDATVRPYVPNSVVGGSAPVNLMNGTRECFAQTTFWSAKTQCTLLDYAAVGPSGATDAATMISSGTGWVFARQLQSVPAGTYTVAAFVKRNTGTDQTFKFSIPVGVTATQKTATAVWQRFTQTFTHAGGTIANLGLINDAATQASLQITDIELYAGSSDLGPEPASVGHLFLGRTKWQNTGSYASGILDMSAANTFGLIQFPTNYNTSAGVTVVTLARKKSASSGYVASLSTLENYGTFRACLENNGIPDFFIGNGAVTKPGAQYAANWNLVGKGWFSHAHRYDGTSERTIWFDQGQIQKGTNAPTNVNLRNFFFSTVISDTYGQGYEWADMAFFNRSLTDEEIVTAQQVMLAESGLDRGVVRFGLFAGDSISNGTAAYPYLYLANDSPEVIGGIYTVVNGTMADVGLNLIGKVIPADRAPGSKYIVTFMVTNGLSDAAAYLATLGTIVDTLKAQGALVYLATLLPRGNTGHNTLRNAVNVGIDAMLAANRIAGIIPFAADPTIGTDAAGFDTGLYPDGIHPTNTVQSNNLEPIFRPVVNAA
jgi:hypothetical protein